MWLWLSMIPGTTVRPRRSMTFVSCPWSPLDAWPTSTKRPSLIDTAETTVFSSSIVCILPLTNTVSGASFDGGRGRWSCFSAPCSSSRAALLSIEPLAAAAAAAPWMNLRREKPRRFPLSEAISVLLVGKSHAQSSDSPWTILPACSVSTERRRFSLCVYKPIIQSSLSVVFFPAVALWQSDQAAFARRVDRAVLAAGREVDEDGVHVADVGRTADHVAERLQLGDLGLVEACFARDDVSGRGHRDARRLDRLLERHVVIHQVDEHVVDRADDGRAAGRAEGGNRLAALEEDRRRHAAARALAALDVVRTGPAEARVHLEAEVEVGELVVEHEAVAGNHDSRPPALLDGRRVRIDFSPLVDHREVRGVAAGVAHRLCGRKHRATRTLRGLERPW